MTWFVARPLPPLPPRVLLRGLTRAPFCFPKEPLHVDLATRREREPALPRDECPDDLVFAAQPFGLDLHPSRDLLAVGLVSGVVSAFHYAMEGNRCVLDGVAAPAHAAAAKCVRFSRAGNLLFSSGTDMALVVTDVETGARGLAAAEAAANGNTQPL